MTQCPIAANSSFLYNFTPTEQAGTFWYHSHLGTQYCDGLRGPLVIYDPDDPYLDLYDVDDGIFFRFINRQSLTQLVFRLNCDSSFRLVSSTS